MILTTLCSTRLEADVTSGRVCEDRDSVDCAANDEPGTIRHARTSHASRVPPASARPAPPSPDNPVAMSDLAMRAKVRLARTGRDDSRHETVRATAFTVRMLQVERNGP